MSEQVFSHKPVLLDECIEALAIRPEGVYLDGTLGRAGHSREIARRLTTGRLICVDRDQAALDAAGERLLSAPAGRRSLLLMDELGFLERCSPVFQRAVFTLLDGPTPVLGVLRRHAKSPFWGPVSRRADVRLLPLTVENRAEIPTELARLLG